VPHADDLQLALRLADLAAITTLERFGGRHDVRMKTDDTPVTEVDARVERQLRELIARERPGDGVHGEEGGLDPGTTGRVWVIDPIDGTKLFAEGIPLWTTLIGLREGDDVVVGVADAPALHERFHASRGDGAYRNGERLRVSDVDRVEQSFVMHAGLDEFARDDVSDLLRLIDLARGSRGISDAWAHLLVARGAAEVLVEPGACHEWDWAATSLVVSEAGGEVAALRGGPPRSGEGLLVSNGRVDAEVRALLGLPGAPQP
jgi:histidinol-phosphatase